MKTCVVGLVLALCCLGQIEDSPSARLRFVEQMQVAASEVGTLRAGDDKDVRTLIVDIDPKRFGFPPGYADRNEIERDLLTPFSARMRPSLCKVGFRTLHTNWGSVLSWDFRLDCSENQETPAEKTAPETLHWREQLLGKPVTLRSVRSIFLGQTVVIGGALYHDRMLLDWIVAHAVGFWFKADDYQKLPMSYRGQTAKVLAVQLNEVHRTPQKTNALGEPLSDDDALNPYFDLVVRFDDGTLAMTTTYAVSLATGQEVELASNQNRLDTEMSTELPKIVGRDVYAVGYSRLYEPDTTLAELVGEPGTGGILKRLSLSDVPFLEPLQIVAAKYVDSVNGVVLKLRMPDGGSGEFRHLKFPRAPCERSALWQCRRRAPEDPHTTIPAPAPEEPS